MNHILKLGSTTHIPFVYSLGELELVVQEHEPVAFEH